METHFHGTDMARVISALRPELGDEFAEIHPAVVRRMTDICANPDRPVNLRTADAVVTAMGCPHVLTNGAVRVVDGHSRKGSNGHVAPRQFVQQEEVRGHMLPAAPMRKWMERQSRHYRTLTAMYLDLGLAPKQGSAIWAGTTKQLNARVIAAALARRGVELHEVYPQNGKVI